MRQMFGSDCCCDLLGAEITLSPVHVYAMGVIGKGSGLAIRFPRFTGNYRLDKATEDATATTEIVEKILSLRESMME